MTDVRGWNYDSEAGTYKPPPGVTSHSHSSLLDGLGDLDALAAALTSRLIPVGVVSPYVGATAPTNWLICDGSTFSAATYPALNTLLGGNTLPNLKGRVVVGVDAAQAEFDVLGESGGAKSHVLTTAELASHGHTTGNQSSQHSHAAVGADYFCLSGTGTSYVVDQSAGSQSFILPDGGNLNTANATTNHTHTVNANGSGTAHNNLQPYIAYNYIIKAA